MLTHTFIALALQLICSWFTADWWLGAAIGSAFYIWREIAQAYATTTVGGSGPSAADIAAQVRAALAADLERVIQIQTKVDAAL